ncbi:hypothetical protein ACH5RR_028753 [Cinchona calisaya]|uniref:Uncharacterized protein n=1 Tax=Cinchona calisaya TaxID=153742 RepID=A0ABD2YPP6_9GENT
MAGKEVIGNKREGYATMGRREGEGWVIKGRGWDWEKEEIERKEEKKKVGNEEIGKRKEGRSSRQQGKRREMDDRGDEAGEGRKQEVGKRRRSVSVMEGGEVATGE